MTDQQHRVPAEALLVAVEGQRNAALTDAAQMRALAQTLEVEVARLAAENAQLREENAKLREEADDGSFGSR
ncbi:hypothetical protein [Nonomuraea sp. GTA35]|uniref:hypothetical protein n=1 Tax=Nonomuraea sp. GTA35 TaxID=1676746 RepID=UPI0035BF8DFE